MTENMLKVQFVKLHKTGLKKKDIIKELKGYIPRANWHTLNTYFNNNQKMSPVKRIVMEGAIETIIKKY